MGFSGGHPWLQYTLVGGRYAIVAQVEFFQTAQIPKECTCNWKGDVDGKSSIESEARVIYIECEV